MLIFNIENMLSLLSILQIEIHLFPALVVLIFILPLSSYNKLRYYGCYTVFFFVTSFFSSALLPFFLLRPKNVLNSSLGASMVKPVSRLIGIKWELRRGEILREDRGAVVVANHQSIYDVLGMFDFWDVMGKVAAVAKKEIFYLWPFGLSAWLAGVVFIDRAKGREANIQLDEVSWVITTNKTKLWIFPEGKINKETNIVLPFKKGAFRVAIACQAPIIPVVFSPYYFINREKEYIGKGRIIIHVLDPVPTVGKTEEDLDILIKEVRDKMVEQYELLKEEVLPGRKQSINITKSIVLPS